LENSRKNRKQHHKEIENVLLNGGGAGKHADALKNALRKRRSEKILTSSSKDLGTSYTESFRVKGLSTLTAQTMSVNPKLLKEIETQKQILKKASSYRAFQGDSGQEELQKVAATTRTMRNFWESMSSNTQESGTKAQNGTSFLSKSFLKGGWGASGMEDNTGIDEEVPDMEAEFVLQSKNDGQVHPLSMRGDLNVYKGVHGLSQVESEALQKSASQMRDFWKRVEQRKSGAFNAYQKRSDGLYVGDVTFSVSVGVDENVACAPSRLFQAQSQASSFNLLETPSQSKHW
jgi:hypothetical protein